MAGEKKKYVSQMTKTEFLLSLDQIISDRIYLTEDLTELKKEIENNKWSIGIERDLASQLRPEDLHKFFKKLIENRRDQLINSEKGMDLLFYLWFDEQSGNLNFNFINSAHKQLPFIAKFEFLDSIDDILTEFLNSEYTEGIPWIELKEVSDNDHEIKQKDFKLKVYQEQIIKNTQTD